MAKPDAADDRLGEVLAKRAEGKDADAWMFACPSVK
jgi:hypothetical protein